MPDRSLTLDLTPALRWWDVGGLASALLVVVAISLWPADPGDRSEAVFFSLSQFCAVGVGAVLFASRQFSSVVVDANGIVQARRWGRDRLVPWADVDSLGLDPPGGPRVPRLTLRDGRQLSLPPLGEEDLALLLAWVTAATDVVADHAGA